jgi:flagellin
VTSGGNSGTLGATYNSGTNVITVNVAAQSTVAQVDLALDGLTDFSASVGPPAVRNRFNFSDFANLSGRINGGSDGTNTASYSGTTLTVNVALGATIGDVAGAINTNADFNATATSGSGAAFNTSDFGTRLNPLSGGVDAGGSDVLGADLVFKLSGASGADVFQFNAGSTIGQVVDAINLVSDATGVQAADNGGVLELRSTGYGSSSLVDVEVIDEGVGGTFEAGLSDTRTTGTDIVGTINGFTASGNGNTLSINTSTLDVSLTVADGSNTDVNFTITGGGAIFQLGPEVVSNQQTRLGIGSVNTGSLGGVSGRLYELRKGNAADLSSDTSTAARIVDEAISSVTELRGRLGAFQRTTLDTNIASLNDTITNLTEAESSIRDADFAAESARLTRAQILVQSGTAVLSIANQNPQQVLSLLR